MINMKILLLLYLSLAVVMAVPPLEPGNEEVKSAPELLDKEQSQSVVVKNEPEVEAGVKAEGAVKVESAGKEEGAVKMESEVKAEGAVKVESAGKEEGAVKMESEVKAEGAVKVESAGKEEGAVKMESEVKAEGAVKVESAGKEEGAVKMESEVKAEGAVKVESAGKAEGAVKVEPEADLKVAAKPEAEAEPGLVDDPDFKVESEVKLEPAVLAKIEPLEEPESDNPQGALAKLNLEAPEAEQELGGEQGLEKTVLEDPAVDQEQDDDDDMLEQGLGKAEEASERAFEPVEEPIESYEGVPESILPETEGDGLALDSMGQKMRSVQEYFPDEEAKELTSGFGPEEKEKAMAAMVEEEGEAATQQTAASRTRYCPGVILYGRCYRFFREPRRAESAEFFCQDRFPNGHLASITSAYVHRELMKLIRRQNGRYTRTWIGGLRYLQTNRFIWLDGSRWQYADWLSGQPNHTAGLENCVEVLPWGNGKFNDFTCWEPQAFICSYPYQ